MVQKRTCDYTGEAIEPGTGTMFVRNDGTVLWFKDSKARKNYMLGRESRDLEWIHGEQDVPEPGEPEETVEDETDDTDTEEADSEDADETETSAEEGDAADAEDETEETEAEA